MARPLRVEFPKAFYHITSRGIERRKIFLDVHDHRKFLHYLEENLKRYKILIYAYVLMDNHYHLLLETLEANLSKFMHDLNTAYTVYFNKRQKRGGPLLQGRYKAILVDREAYLFELSRYIHLNPVRAGLRKKAEMYPWSSYRTYLGIERREWVHCEWLVERFGKSWRGRFKKFVEEGVDKPTPFEEIKARFILGSDTFVEKVKKRIQRRGSGKEVPSYKELTSPTVEDIVGKIAEFFKIEEIELKKRRRDFLPRKLAIYFVRKYTAEKIEKIGEKFSIGYTGVSKTISRFEREIGREKEIEKIAKEIQKGL